MLSALWHDYIYPRNINIIQVHNLMNTCLHLYQEEKSFFREGSKPLLNKVQKLFWKWNRSLGNKGLTCSSTWALAILLEHMHKKFEINQTKIKGCCQSGRHCWSDPYTKNSYSTCIFILKKINGYSGLSNKPPPRTQWSLEIPINVFKHY